MKVYPSPKPSFYSNRVLQEIGIKEPPVPIAPVMEYFGINLKGISEDDLKGFRESCGEPPDIPSFLHVDDENKTIFVKDNCYEESRRFNIFHECGHFDLPWHSDYNYLCCPQDHENCPNKVKPIEKEANSYASSMLFPGHIFFEELNRLPLSLQSIKYFSKRYLASFAATAINYVNLNPSPCAIVYLNLNSNSDNSGNPFEVKYSVKSKSFHRYWQPGQEIHFNELIWNCFSGSLLGIELKGEIPAAVFGSDKKHHYQAELRPYGSQQVCVLLKIDNKQSHFFKDIKL